MPRTGANRTVAITNDHELDKFLLGELPEPEERVTRRGVPEYRPEFREPRAVADIIASARGKIFRQARIQLKARRFQYTQISQDQIRLLHIRKGRPEDGLVCDLSVKRLADVRGKYEALSYCWGNEQATEDIQIQRWDAPSSDPAHSTDSVPKVNLPQAFPVRPNLLEALRQLRSREKAKVIWVDAICIDQREEQEAKREKNQQLSMMSEIYNSAKQVCIWMGTADTRSKAAFDFVREIMNFSVLDKYLVDIDRRTKDKWCDLVHTLNAPWFSRRWIIQEIASARDASVHFGDDSVHWDDLADAISLLNEHHEALIRETEKDTFARVPMLSAVQLVKAIGNVCRKSPNGEIVEKLLDFETLVCTFQQFHASFSEDIIHSVRALAKDAPTQEEEDDFRTAVEHQKSTRDLFIAFVNRCIMTSASLDIICRHWAPPAMDTVDTEVKLPTWISELSKGPFGLSHQFHERQNGENFVALFPDKRKRYNASSGYAHFHDQSDSDQPTRKSSIVPTISVSAPKAPDSNRVQFFPGNDVLLSPLALSALDGQGYFFPIQDGLEPTLTDAEPGHTAAAEAELSPKISVRLPEGSPGRSSESVHNVPLQISSKQVERAARPRSAGDDASQTPVSPLTTLPPHLRSHSSSVSPRQGPTAISATIPATKRQAPGIWYVVDQVTKAHASKRQRKDQTIPKSKQDSYTQEDKEHNEKLGGTLVVHGLILGTIVDHSDVMRGGIVPGNWLKRLGWDPKSKENRVPDSVWRTLVADRTSDGGMPQPWYKRACLHCLKDTRITNARGDLDSHKVNKLSASNTVAYLTRVESVVWRRRIIEVQPSTGSSEALLYGLAPEDTEEGDLICILFGCSVPVVLRRHGQVAYDSQAEMSYEVVGESYIHGKMDGEAVQDKHRVRQHRRRFLLV